MQSHVTADTPTLAEPVTQSTIRLDPMLVNSFNKDSGVPQQVVLYFQNELTEASVQMAERLGVTFVRQQMKIVHVGRVYVAWITSLDALHSLSSLGLIQATDGSKTFTPALTSSVPVTNATTVWNNLSKAGQRIDGRDARVAIIDTGIQWTHPSFWRVVGDELNVLYEDGKYYADLNNNMQVDDGEGPIRFVDISNPGVIDVANEYLYVDVDNNSHFDYADGDRWLAGVDSNDDGILSLPSEKVVLLGECKVLALYDQTTDRVYLRDYNLTTLALNVGDENGHGTHVASIIAAGQIGYTAMLGMAPGADLIVIKSTLQSADIVRAIHFAVELGADVINMSFSSFGGFLDGTDVEDLAISEVFLKSGVLSTIATGNLGGQSKHARVQVNSNTSKSVVLTVALPPMYSFLNILWQSDNADEHIVLTSPNDEQTDLGAFSTIRDRAFEIDTEDLKAYVFASTSLRGTNQVIIQIGTTEHRWALGSWSVRVTNPDGGAIEVDMYAWDNSWSESNLRFGSRIDNLRTLSCPATADLGIAVASYDEGSAQISTTSGRGPRIDGISKPEVAAPGVNILASSRQLTSLWETRSGTSMASPHVAGLVALLRQALGQRPGWMGLTALLQGAGGSESHFTLTDPSWGYGLCDALASVRMLIVPPVESMLDEWAGISPVVEDSLDPLVEGRLDIREVRLHQTRENITLAITMRENVSFADSSEFRIEWDTDSNSQTGYHGIELRARLTNGILSLLEWAGTEFVSSSLRSGYWYDQGTLFVWLEMPDVGTRGNITLITYNTTSTQVDLTDWLILENQWPVLIESMNYKWIRTTFNITVNLSDLDSSSTDLILRWQLVDGAMQVLESGVEQGESIMNFTFDTGAPLGRSSVILNVTDGYTTLQTDPILLALISASVEFIETRLDNEEVIVGPFIYSIVTGRIVVSGNQYVNRLMLGLQSSDGKWLNLTLEGVEGVYEILFSAANMKPCTYRVFAIVLTTTGLLIENEFATLKLIEVNVIPFILAAVIVGAVATLAFRRFKKRI